MKFGPQPGAVPWRSLVICIYSLNVAHPNSGSASIEVWQFSSGHDATSSVLDDVRGESSRHSEWSTSVDKTVHNMVDIAVDNFGDKQRFKAPPPAPPRRA
jgi:hypothetical protein